MENKFLVRGKDIINKIWIKNSIIEIINDRFYINYCEVDFKSVGRFTGLTDDSEVTLDEPINIFEGDILELQYEGDVFNCVVAWEICGFLLGSEYFEDSYIWLTEVMESENNYHWIGGAKLIGNKYDNPGLLLK